MPPARTNGAGPSKRRPPPFKPPRPVNASATASNSSAKPTSKPSSKPHASTNKTKSFSRQASMVISSEADSQSEEDISRDNSDDNEIDDDDLDDSVFSTRATAAKRTSYTGTKDTHTPPIPQKLLARLLYESFSDKNMKVGKDAMAVFGKYIEIFVREGLARAAYERDEADSGVSGAGDGFLQVEDLEKLAPQLLLDF